MAETMPRFTPNPAPSAKQHSNHRVDGGAQLQSRKLGRRTLIPATSLRALIEGEG